MERETAMKILKELHDNSLFSNRIALETLIPELADSNDERIRKCLIDFFEDWHENKSHCWGIAVTAILAWLEKQKEFGTFDAPQTPIKDAVEVTSRMQFISDDMKPIAEFIMGYANWDLHKDEWNQPTLTVPLFRVLDALIQRGKPYSECSQNIEKQGEQKPADKVEPRFKVKYAGSEYNVLEVKDIAGVTFYGIEDEPNHIDYVKAENCEIISGYAIKENSSLYPTKPAVFSEKKTAAWSDEDEEHVESILERLEGMCKKGATFTATRFAVNQDMDWLKSLKDRIGG